MCYNPLRHVAKFRRTQEDIPPDPDPLMEADKSEEEKSAIEEDEDMQDPEEPKDSPLKPKIESDSEEEQPSNCYQKNPTMKKTNRKVRRNLIMPQANQMMKNLTMEARRIRRRRREPMQEEDPEELPPDQLREDTHLRSMQVALLQNLLVLQ